MAPIIVIYIVVLASGETPALRWLLLLPFLLVQLVFNFGAALMAARATNSVSDLNQVLPFVFRILLYVSGVLFDVGCTPRARATSGSSSSIRSSASSP